MNGDRIKEALRLQPLTEEEKKSRHILGRLYGPVATCSEATRNGRQYNRELWEKALNDDVFKEKVANKSLFLELGHPDGREETDMTKVCACIPEMPKLIGDDLYAYIDILDTPNGRLLKTLCDYGFVPGISSRGTGDVDEESQEVDPNTFYLETWDIVQLPAVKKARLKMCESLEESLTSPMVQQARRTIRREKTAEGRKVMTEAMNGIIKRAVSKRKKGKTLRFDVNEASSRYPTLAPDESDVSDTKTLARLEKQGKIKNIDGAWFIDPGSTRTTETDPEDAEIFADNRKFSLQYFPELKSHTSISGFTEILPPARESWKLREEDEEKDTAKEETPEIDLLNGFSAREISRLLRSHTDDEGNVYLSLLPADERETTAIRQLTLTETEDGELALEYSTEKGDEDTALSAETNSGDSEKVKSLTDKVEQLQRKLSVAENYRMESNQKLENLIAENVKLESESQKLTESLKSNDSDTRDRIQNLLEQVRTLKKSAADSQKLAESYKAKYAGVLNRYIDSKAKMLGVRREKIVESLGNSYTLDDIDSACNRLLHESTSSYSLPKSEVKVRVNSNNNVNNDPDSGYEIDDSLLELAGLK